jgi:hypothetical protein
VVDTTAMVYATSKTFFRSQFFQNPCDAKDLEEAIARKEQFRSQKTLYIQKIKASTATGEHGEPYASSA